MNSNWMTVEELRVFSKRIDRVLEACGPLERVDLHPEICLSDAETLIRCAPVLPSSTPGLVVVEPVALAGRALAMADAEQNAVQKKPAPEAKPAPAPIADKAAMTEGPLSDAEKLDILDGHARGETSKEIARRLQRRPQAVGLYINLMTRTGALEDDPAPKPPAPEVKPVAPVATVDAPPPVPPAPLSEFDRKMTKHLHGLPRAMDWDMACDLAMCEAFGRGSKLAQVALDMGKDAQWIKHRYAQVTNKIRDDRGHMKIEGQVRLLHLMRDLCAAQGVAA